MILPDWLKIGAVVRCTFYVGRVEDILVSDNRIMLLIVSPKGVWQILPHGTEWVQYDLSPDAVSLATEADLQVDVKRYTRLVERQMEMMREMFG